jgi:hypothetical protein
MVRKLVAALVLAVPLAVSAEFSFGINVNYSLSDEITTSSTRDPSLETGTVRNTGFGLEPYIGIHAGEIVEISPLVEWSMSKHTETVDDSGLVENEDVTTQNRLGIGIGVYMHVIRGDVFGLSLGPQLGYRVYFRPCYDYTTSALEPEYDQYYMGDVWLGCPLNVDLHFNSHVGARVGVNLVRLNYHTHSIDAKGSGTTPDVVHDIDLDVTTVFYPSFGLFFTF